MQRPERRLAAARLADQAQRLAARDRQVDAVDGAQHVVRPAAQRARPASAEREVHVEARAPRAAAQPPAITGSSCTARRRRVVVDAGGAARSASDRPQRLVDRRAVGLRELAARVRSGSPSGGRTRSGGMPGIDRSASRTSSKSGTERSSAQRVRVAGRAEDLVDACRSRPPGRRTSRPARWQVWATTARSWVTNTTLSAALLAQRAQQLAGSDPGSSRRARSSARRRASAAARRTSAIAIIDPLAHAAGQLVRVGARAARRVGDADLAHQVERALAARRLAHARGAPAGPRRSGRPPASPG